MTQENRTEPAPTITALVCGGRNWRYREMTFRKLDALHRKYKFGLLIHGDAPGADTMAGQWGRQRGIPVRAYPANWRPKELKGRVDYKAGHKRNQQMLDEARPDLVIAFPGGPGTNDMIKRSRLAGVPVIHLSDIVASWQNHTGLPPR